MKKALMILFAGMCLSLPTVAQTQNQGDSRLHTFGTYGLKWENFGVGAGIEYFFLDQFAIMPSYTYLMPEVGNGSNFSMDFRYYVSDGPSQLYFLAGYSHNWENSQPGNAGVRRNYKGANVGVGAYIHLVDWVGLSTEFKIQSQFPQEPGFKVGFAFPL